MATTSPIEFWLGLLAFLSLAALQSTPARAADCPEHYTALQFEDQLGAAESALASVDIELFKSNMERADQMIPCLSQRVIPSLAATYHRFYGLRLFGARDLFAEKAFKAARYLEPGYVFSRSLIADGNPIHKAFEGVTFDDRPVDPLEAPGGGSIYIDGSRSLQRPNEWPTLIQWVEGNNVHFSEYLLPGNPVPTYPLASDISGVKRDPSLPLLATSGGTAVLAGALYGIALINQGRYKNTVNPVPDPDLTNLRRTTNTLVVVSGISAATAVGTGVAVVATW